MRSTIIAAAFIATASAQVLTALPTIAIGLLSTTLTVNSVLPTAVVDPLTSALAPVLTAAPIANATSVVGGVVGTLINTLAPGLNSILTNIGVSIVLPTGSAAVSGLSSVVTNVAATTTAATSSATRAANSTSTATRAANSTTSASRAANSTAATTSRMVTLSISTAVPTGTGIPLPTSTLAASSTRVAAGLTFAAVGAVVAIFA